MGFPKATASEDLSAGIQVALGGRSAEFEGEEIERLDDIVHRVIAFANSEISPDWTRRVSPANGKWVMRNDPSRTRLDMYRATERAEREIEDERAFAKEVLAAAVEGPASIARFLIAAQKRGFRTNVRLAPALRVKNSRAGLAFYATGSAFDSRGWALFAGALLANGTTLKVGRCHLPACAKFFVDSAIREKAGAPRTRYCCREHRLEHHALEAGTRKRRSRERIRNARKSK